MSDVHQRGREMWSSENIGRKMYFLKPATDPRGPDKDPVGNQEARERLVAGLDRVHPSPSSLGLKWRKKPGHWQLHLQPTHCSQFA